MNPEVQTLLVLIAEVAIGTVALSGITMVLLVSGGRVDEMQRGTIAAQLSMAFVVVLVAIFPLLVNQYGLDAITMWRVSSAGYLMLVLGFFAVWGLGLTQISVLQEVPVITRLPASSALILLGYNLWSGTDWPYVTQLFIALAVSMILYLSFVYRALTEPQAEDERA
jgi:hypothetical protein